MAGQPQEQELEFDFETSLDGSPKELPSTVSQQQQRRNFKKTVCRYWLKNLCMKGNVCSFLHQYDPDRMPICRYFAKHGYCKEEDCPYSHSNDGIRECNMFNIGFCIHGPNCIFKHVKRAPPRPTVHECSLIGTQGYRFLPPSKKPRADKEPHAYEVCFGEFPSPTIDDTEQPSEQPNGNHHLAHHPPHPPQPPASHQQQNVALQLTDDQLGPPGFR